MITLITSQWLTIFQSSDSQSYSNRDAECLHIIAPQSREDSVLTRRALAGSSLALLTLISTGCGTIRNIAESDPAGRVYGGVRSARRA